MRYDLVVLGHVSRDIMIEHTGEESRLLGGAVFHAAITAARTGAKVLAITRAAASDVVAAGRIREAGAELLVLPCGSSTSIRNVFLAPDHERRNTTLLSRADPILPGDVPSDIGGRTFLLAGLFVGELPDSMIAALAPKAMVAVDAQGLLRHARPDGTMEFRDWEAKKRYLPYVHFFKTDAAEAGILTGTDDRERAARIIADWGAREVMVTHNTEALVYAEGAIHRAPFTPSNLSGRTGRGDTTFSAYLCRRCDHDPGDSIRFAAALCSIKMEKPGPFDGTIEQVLARMRRDSRS